MSELSEWMNAVTGPAIVTIDGPSGAGKSTFASRLIAAHPDWLVIRLDDVYRDWDDLIPTVEIMRHDCVVPLLTGRPARWPKWSWPRTGPIVPTEIPSGSRVIIEGSGSTAMVPLGANGVRQLWVETPDALRANRIIERDGRQFDAYWPIWFAHWDEYESQFRPRERCERISGYAQPNS